MLGKDSPLSLCPQCYIAFRFHRQKIAMLQIICLLGVILMIAESYFWDVYNFFFLKDTHLAIILCIQPQI